MRGYVEKKSRDICCCYLPMKSKHSNAEEYNIYLTSHLKNEQDTAREARTKFKMTFFYKFLQMDVPNLADQQELIFIRSVRIQDEVWKTCQERWTIGTFHTCCRFNFMINIFYYENVFT